MLKTIICCASVFAVILLVGWVLGLIMIHLFEKKIRQQKPQSVVVHINDGNGKPNTYTLGKVKREQRSKPKHVEGFQSGCGCGHHNHNHSSPKKLRQRVKPPKREKTIETFQSTVPSPVIENFDPFIGKYQRQSAKAERRFTRHGNRSPLRGYNIKEYDGTNSVLASQ